MALASFLSLSSCGLFGFKHWNWHQRLVLEVETPNGPVTGGSVVNVKLRRVPEWLPSNNPGAILSDIEGEASFVEVAPGRYLFALVRGGGEAQLARETFFPYPETDVPEANGRLEEFTGQATLSPRAYPRLVTFTDINNPATVRLVDPDNLAATFGPGYQLKSVTLEIADEPETKGEVEKVLTWLNWPKIDPSINDGRTETLRYPNASPRGYGTLSTLDFIRR